MDVKDIVVGMVGSGGDGVAAAGDILTTSCASEGLHCMMVKSFGPQIRGGESSVRVKISTEPVATQGDILDVLVVLSWADYKKFPGELSVGNETVVITDEKDCPDPLPLENGAKPKEVFKIPFESLVKESGNSRSKNIITLGVLAELFNLPKTGLKKAVEKRFKGKKVEILQSSFKAIDLGIGYAQKNNFKSYLQMNYKPGDVNYVANGNDALSYGALVAGCKFFSSYPITPASEIMEWLSRELPKFGGTMVQAEDEIAAICTVIGASFGGVKSMTATSGPGLSLKMEGIGLACMAEIPVVIVDVQRGGPSTGLPTKTEQSDLWQAVGGSHGDVPHVVLAPSDVEDCFEIAIRAFNIAEKYQLPVIILSDQFVGQRKETIKKFNVENRKLISRLVPKDPKSNEYKRFELTENGVSPMAIPGMKGGEYNCPGIEHNEYGAPTASYFSHEIMCKKREKKLEGVLKDYDFIRRYGEKKADLGIIAWGSTKGAVKETVERAAGKGLKVAALVPQLIYPLQADEINKFVSECKKILVVEMSYSGQFMRYLKSSCDIPKDALHLKMCGGKYIETIEILSKVEEVLK